MNKDLDVIFNGVFGSHLYGLSTPKSDKDFKGVYLPTKKELVFNTYKDSIDVQTKEVDTTFYAVTKFAKILSKVDTVSLDMIHTPSEFTITTSALWEEIRSYRSDLYCKNARGVLGYIRTQAAKFCHKQDRYKEMKELLGLIEGTDLTVKVVHTTLPEIIQRSGFKFIKYVPEKGNISGNIDVCGSRYQINAAVSYMKDGLDQKLVRYGERTLAGNKAGGDFKSMSHSYRVLLQLEEIIDTRGLKFPLTNRDEILKIKVGEYSQEDVMSRIDELYSKVTSKLEYSDLPEESDITRIEDCIMNHLGSY